MNRDQLTPVICCIYKMKYRPQLYIDIGMFLMSHEIRIPSFINQKEWHERHLRSFFETQISWFNRNATQGIHWGIHWQNPGCWKISVFRLDRSKRSPSWNQRQEFQGFPIQKYATISGGFFCSWGPQIVSPLRGVLYSRERWEGDEHMMIYPKIVGRFQ